MTHPNPQDAEPPVPEPPVPEPPVPEPPVPSRCSSLAVEDLVAWADGELAQPDVARVAGHVADCAVCSREADLLRRSAALLDRLPAPGASPGFADRVIAAARSDGLRTAAGAAPAGRLLALPRMRQAVAAAVVLVAAGGSIWLAGRSGGMNGTPGALSSADEDAIARDLLVLANLDALEGADADELASLVDQLDLLDAAETGIEEQGG